MSRSQGELSLFCVSGCILHFYFQHPAEYQALQYQLPEVFVKGEWLLYPQRAHAALPSSQLPSALCPSPAEIRPRGPRLPCFLCLFLWASGVSKEA